MSKTPYNPLLARAVIISQFAPPFMFSGVAVVIPGMGSDLHAGAVSLGLVESLFLASQLAFLLAVGRLADSSDKRTLYKYGLLGFAVLTLLIGIISHVPSLLVLRFLQGIASAIFAATGPAILAELVPAEQRGRAYGSSIGVIYAGLTLGPLVAGYLNDHFGWRAVFLVGGMVLLAACGLVFRLMPSVWRRPPKGAVHLPSAALLVAAALSLVVASSLISQTFTGYIFLCAGGLLATIFVRLQLRLPAPLLDIRALIANPPLHLALLTQFLLYVSAASTVFMLSLYLQVTLAQTAGVAGQIIAAGTVLMVVIAPLSGRLADAYPPRWVSCFGLACVLVSSLMGTTLHEGSGLAFVTLMFTLQGVGFSFFASPNMKLIMGSVSADKTGMASALGAKARSLGMMSGALIATALISSHYGNTPVSHFPERFSLIPSVLYTILAVLTAIALLLSVGAPQKHMKR